MDKQKLKELIGLYNIRVMELEGLIDFGTVNSEFIARTKLEVYQRVVKDLKSLLHD